MSSVGSQGSRGRGRRGRGTTGTAVSESDTEKILRRNQNIEDAFESYKLELDQRERVREEYREWIRTLETLSGKFNSVVSGIFSARYETTKEKTVTAGYEVLDEIQSALEDKEKDIKFNEDWFNSNCAGDITDHFNEVLSRLSKCCVIFRYIEKEEYASKDDVTEMLGLSPELNVNSYLEGVLGIAEDLVRYATLGVAFGFYSRPIIVGEFLNKVYQGFVSIGKKDERLTTRMRQFESEIKKLEHVMFEVSIRFLTGDGDAEER